MTPAEFAAWRHRMGLTRPMLLAALHRLGWTSLSLRGLDAWMRRDPLPGHVSALLTLMERAPGAWRDQ
jgi:hypothetical protein